VNITYIGIYTHTHTHARARRKKTEIRKTKRKLMLIMIDIITIISPQNNYNLLKTWKLLHTYDKMILVPRFSYSNLNDDVFYIIFYKLI